MALSVTIGGGGTFFVGEDKTLSLEVLDATVSTPVDMTGWTVLFVIRPSDNAAQTILSASATITGVYNATRATNTQRATVVITDTTDEVWHEGTYRHSWKRTDSGSETILAYGDFVLQRATQVA